MAKNEQPKIIIGLPCTEMMKAKTAHAIGCAMVGNPDIIDFLMIQSCDISSSRIWLVKEAIKNGATHLFFVDSDMLFPTDTIKRLLAHDKDIISVDYNKRKFPLQSVLALLPDTEKSETELYKVAVVGTGIMLINLEIFKDPKMDKNWFSFGRNAEGEHVMGEDGWFCNTAREAGYDIWVDSTIKVVHLGEYGY